MSTKQRSPERLRHHFEVERELAKRLRASTREERPTLFKTLYDELFERVPDHPRLTRLVSPEESLRKVNGQLRLVQPFLKKDDTFLEFAPGDCRLGFAACKLTQRVIGIDISDQRSSADVVPPNYEHCVYDGYHLGLPSGIADVAFSYQFLEHLHPDDVGPHMDLVHRLLKPGGWYVFDTPHRMSGPHDISAAFGTELVCFHFQEWTYAAMRSTLMAHGFDAVRAVRRGRMLGAVTTSLMIGLEQCVGLLPLTLRRKVASRLFASVSVAARAGGAADG
ncbi:MAG: class I SAM-dependent methyltransferase [Verrucomicrobiaceae bacterium]|nr:class I SAM-dependent methyltransferase [Verrucomicrobiaceae bacterium]